MNYRVILGDTYQIHKNNQMFLATIHLIKLLLKCPETFLKPYIRGREKYLDFGSSALFFGGYFHTIINCFLSNSFLLFFSSPSLLFVPMHEGKFPFHFAQAGSQNLNTCFLVRQYSQGSKNHLHQQFTPSLVNTLTKHLYNTFSTVLLIFW